MGNQRKFASMAWQAKGKVTVFRLRPRSIKQNGPGLPHNASLNLLAAVESHHVPPELTGGARSALTDKRDRLLILLHYCCGCYEHPWLEGGSKE
jgi:hypothetical protein